MTADPETAATLQAIWDKKSPSFNVKFSLRNLYSASWYAALLVNTDDIPRLMREGLNFTETNVCHELGAVCPNAAGSKGRLFWSGRVYFLTHLPADGGEPFWTAALLVFGKDLFTVSNFRLGDVSLKMVYQCTAVNKQGELVYSYSSNPEYCFNAIYDGLILKVIWPGHGKFDSWGYHYQEEGQKQVGSFYCVILLALSC
ncbi:hypothetical protein QBC40DRAFT_237308 [Triangularia verruculosa]|uniref:Uncharacterized protein n=1 Tax=Triangularia verruculosa TaxID=2587418 RepID=A0AAN7ARK1_9PEZI|nr:hypothetical protein QBC40DRAFT_237308 [Triangularia verruculosa]